MPDTRNYGDGLVPVENPTGAWVTYYADSNGLSGVTIFATEVEALRHAVGGGMTVAFLPFGKDLNDVDTERWVAARGKA